MTILTSSFSHLYPKGNETYTFGEELNGLSKYAVSLYSVNKRNLKHFIQLYYMTILILPILEPLPQGS